MKFVSFFLGLLLIVIGTSCFANDQLTSSFYLTNKMTNSFNTNTNYPFIYENALTLCPSYRDDQQSCVATPATTFTAYPNISGLILGITAENSLKVWKHSFVVATPGGLSLAYVCSYDFANIDINSNYSLSVTFVVTGIANKVTIDNLTEIATYVVNGKSTNYSGTCARS
jgi:hypothetical protein